MTKNIILQKGYMNTKTRWELLGQKGCVVWLTGLSGSGKSTIAMELDKRLVSNGHLAYVLDGDNIRHRLNRDLGFSQKDRKENIRRVSEMAALFADVGVITITAFISPIRTDRLKARQIIGQNRFIEVFINTPIEECEKRDPKGLYKKARDGVIKKFTAINSPYQPPEGPELILRTLTMNVSQCAATIVKYLDRKGFLNS